MYVFATEAKDGSVALKRDPDEAPADNMNVILESEDKKDSHEQPNGSTSQKAIVGSEFVLANDVIMENENEAMASMNQNQNNKRNDGIEMSHLESDKTGVKKESNEQEATNDGDDIPMVQIPLEILKAWMDVFPKSETPTDEINHNASSAEDVECSNRKKQGISNDIDFHSIDKIFPKDAANKTKPMQKKEGEKHKCRFCDYSTNYGGDLLKHERTHTGAKPYRCGPRYECHICKKTSFVRKSTFDRHMLVHNGKKPFHCEICWKHFNRKDSLKRHLNAIHHRNCH